MRSCPRTMQMHLATEVTALIHSQPHCNSRPALEFQAKPVYRPDVLKSHRFYEVPSINGILTFNTIEDENTMESQIP
jgi:hypothetical protein